MSFTKQLQDLIYYSKNVNVPNDHYLNDEKLAEEIEAFVMEYLKSRAKKGVEFLNLYNCPGCQNKVEEVHRANNVH